MTEPQIEQPAQESASGFSLGKLVPVIILVVGFGLFLGFDLDRFLTFETFLIDSPHLGADFCTIAPWQALTTNTLGQDFKPGQRVAENLLGSSSMSRYFLSRVINLMAKFCQ